MRPIAKSLPKTLDVKSTIFEHRIGFLRQNRLGTKLSGNTSSTTYLSTSHLINDFGGNQNTSENHS